MERPSQRRAVHMTREEAYKIALEMNEEDRAAFKAFLSALLENEDTALLLASAHQESV